jgi:hypothetical protein
MTGAKKPGGLHGALKKIALRHPAVEEAVACKGTAIESAAYKVRKKAFLFVGAAVARMKLGSSVAEAKKLAKKSPGSCEVGAGGWTAVHFGPQAPPLGVLERWVDESYRLFAGAEPKATKSAGKKNG